MKLALTLLLGMSSPIFAQGAAITALSADGVDPLGDLVSQLQAMYGYVITYESARYVYEGDMDDVTQQVRRDLDKYAPGRAPKVLVPKGGHLTINASAGVPVSASYVKEVLHQLVQAQADIAVGGRYKVEQAGDEFHVVPTDIRDRDGKWIAQPSILDTRITLPKKERSALGMVNAICDALKIAAHADVGLVSGPMGFLYDTRKIWGADNEPAKDVLERVFKDTGAKLSWRIGYGPSSAMYAVNIVTVTERQDPAAAPPSAATPRTEITGTTAAPTSYAPHGCATAQGSAAAEKMCNENSRKSRAITLLRRRVG